MQIFLCLAINPDVAVTVIRPLYHIYKETPEFDEMLSAKLKLVLADAIIQDRGYRTRWVDFLCKNWSKEYFTNPTVLTMYEDAIEIFKKKVNGFDATTNHEYWYLRSLLGKATFLQTNEEKNATEYALFTLKNVLNVPMIIVCLSEKLLPS